jgi:hypothetical protein
MASLSTTRTSYIVPKFTAGVGKGGIFWEGGEEGGGGGVKLSYIPIYNLFCITLTSRTLPISRNTVTSNMVLSGR